MERRLGDPVRTLSPVDGNASVNVLFHAVRLNAAGAGIMLGADEARLLADDLREAADELDD